MDVQLQRALDPLRRDLTAGGVPAPRVEDRPWADAGQASAWLFGPDGSGRGVAVTLGADPVEQLVELADHVQEWAVEALWAVGLPATWPSCPHHPDRHPLAARLVDGRAMWTCPADDVAVVEVGALVAERPRRRRGGRPRR